MKLNWPYSDNEKDLIEVDFTKLLYLKTARFVVKIRQQDMCKIGSNYISGCLLPYMLEHKQLPKEVVIQIEETNTGKTIPVPEFALSCILQDVLELIQKGVKVSVETTQS
jgi:hypothetical protein